MKCWLSLSGVLAFLLAACGSYEKEQVQLPTNYSVNQNHLTNSNFQFWQRGTKLDVNNGETKYLADRWYVKNELGPQGIITYSQIEPLADGSAYAAAVEITTSPNREEKGSAALYQTLEAADTLALAGKPASFSILVRGIGDARQIGVQFMYADTERPVHKPIGGEAVFAVTPNKLILASIQNVLTGRIPRGGVLGVRIRVTQTQGHTFDRQTGFAVEQAMLNLGPLSAEYQPKNANSGAEFRHCLRYYEKSYDMNSFPATPGIAGAVYVEPPGTHSVRFAERKRAGILFPEIYAPKGHGLNRVVNFVDDTAIAGAEIRHAGESGFTVLVPGITRKVFFQWVADAEIYEP